MTTLPEWVTRARSQPGYGTGGIERGPRCTYA
jgi:hypothetical protein